ncbi:MAG: PIN domain-containing protein [Candidatus Micrarchaeota archaeon]
MTRYIIDSYAWIEYFDGSSAGEKVKRLLETSECFTSSLSIAEVTIKLLKKGMDPSEGYGLVCSLSKELPVTNAISFEAGKVYVEKRKKLKDIGIVDVIIMVQAREAGLAVLTGDREHFAGEKNVVFI